MFARSVDKYYYTFSMVYVRNNQISYGFGPVSDVGELHVLSLDMKKYTYSQ